MNEIIIGELNGQYKREKIENLYKLCEKTKLSNLRINDILLNYKKEKQKKEAQNNLISLFRCSKK